MHKDCTANRLSTTMQNLCLMLRNKNAVVSWEELAADKRHIMLTALCNLMCSAEAKNQCCTHLQSREGWGVFHIVKWIWVSFYLCVISCSYKTYAEMCVIMRNGFLGSFASEKPFVGLQTSDKWLAYAQTHKKILLGPSRSKFETFASNKWQFVCQGWESKYKDECLLA